MEPVRLQKYLADQGLCSRREGERWIEDGLLTVNGKTATLGAKVIPGEDFVKLRGKPVLAKEQKKIFLAVNKPKGVLCTNHDPHLDGETVFDLLPDEYAKEKLFCVGRLDKDSEGLLFITNDGDLANKIMHPSSGIIKRYRVTLNRAFDQNKIPALLKGVTRDGERLFASRIIPATEGANVNCRLEIHLSQGRKREIRRLFEAFGYFVKKLRRHQIGNYVLKNIPSGSARPLSEKDIKRILAKPKKESRVIDPFKL